MCGGACARLRGFPSRVRITGACPAHAQADGKPFETFEKEFVEKVRPASLIKRFASPQEIGEP